MRRYSALTIRSFGELLRYDIVNSILGFRRIHREMDALKPKPQPVDSGTAGRICDAVSLAACFYWKPVLCLQRSVAAARMLRKYGVDGRLVIGYRPSPFLSHAWVEVDDRVVNDSQSYKRRLLVLCKT